MPEAIRLRFPGGGIARGAVVHWLRRPGEPVHRDDRLAIPLFDKVEFELASPLDGTLAEI